MDRKFTGMQKPPQSTATLLIALALSSCTQNADVEPQAQPKDESHASFASAEAAVEGLVTAVEARDVAALERIFGPGGESLVQWGDPIAEEQDRARFLAMYRTKHELVDGPDGQKLLQVGANDWPLPSPLAEKDGRWSFNGVEGVDELVYRRVGQNELGAIRVAHGFVDAQYEYASKRRDGKIAGLFTPYLISDPGLHNGLYWPTEDDEAPSPAGPFVAGAAAEGYRKAASGEPTPYHGYFYRMLYAQGADAPGGAMDYFEDGQMVRGFALLAWPSEYGVSGVKTFMVNQNDLVYERDLGADTATAANDIRLFNPDETWDQVQVEADE